MIEELSLRRRNAFPVRGGTVRMVDHGELSVELDHRPPVRLTISDDRSGHIGCWSVDSWLVAVGEEGDRIASVDLDTGSARILSGLARLDLDGGYDPGGLFRVDFFATPDAGRLVIATEVAVACIDPYVVEWQYVHGDATCRVVEVTDAAVVLDNEYGKIVVGLADGREIL